LLWVDDLEQAALEKFHAHDIDLALEDRLLHSLSDAFARFGHSP